jgi:hypothetical protein
VIREALLAGVAALGLARDPSCGGTDSPTSGVNAPCTRDKDCSGALLCREGICSEGDAGASVSDAAGDARDGEDG